MDITKLSRGNNPPWDFNALIEVPLGGVPVKYEFDKSSGFMVVDRFLHTAMHYPGNYGFIPHTLAEDGDPMDVLVFGAVPVVPGAVIRCRPVGALIMEDEAGGDEKILAVPVEALHPFSTGIVSFEDVPNMALQQIEHFFLHYKDLEKNKFVRSSGWVGPHSAAELIEASIRRADGKAPTGREKAAPKRATAAARNRAPAGRPGKAGAGKAGPSKASRTRKAVTAARRAPAVKAPAARKGAKAKG